jgi:hypothetical protein
MAQKKESGKGVKVQDLAPKKDAKGGAARSNLQGRGSLDAGGSLQGKGGGLDRGGSLDGKGGSLDRGGNLS